MGSLRVEAASAVEGFFGGADRVSKVHDRLLRPLLATDQPPASPPIRKALHTIDIHISDTFDQARLLPQAA